MEIFNSMPIILNDALLAEERLRNEQVRPTMQFPQTRSPTLGMASRGDKEIITLLTTTLISIITQVSEEVQEELQRTRVILEI